MAASGPCTPGRQPARGERPGQLGGSSRARPAPPRPGGGSAGPWEPRITGGHTRSAAGKDAPPAPSEPQEALWPVPRGGSASTPAFGRSGAGEAVLSQPVSPSAGKRSNSIRSNARHNKRSYGPGYTRVSLIFSDYRGSACALCLPTAHQQRRRPQEPVGETPCPRPGPLRDNVHFTGPTELQVPEARFWGTFLSTFIDPQPGAYIKAWALCSQPWRSASGGSFNLSEPVC